MYKNEKRLLIFGISLVLILNCNVFAKKGFDFNNEDDVINYNRYGMTYDQIKNQNKEKEKQTYKRSGTVIETKDGFLNLPEEKSVKEQKKCDDEENFKRYKMTPEEIEENNKLKSDIIYKRTGYRVKAISGVLMLPEELDSRIELRAINIPNSYCPFNPYNSDWSGTKNYSYTRYIFKAGSFYANADNYFQVEMYSPSGVSLGAESSIRMNGREGVAWLMDRDYYSKLTNLTNRPMERAYYGASH